ncbi:MAG TPA: VOC family protein [Kofleriaceae bacterium]|nr:VOC family protein [Kofleriaceae bacterium]
MQLITYLNFNGQCRDAFSFYEKCLGGKIEGMFTFGSSGMAEHVSPEWHDRIMHASLTADGQVLMGSDSPDGRGERTQGFSVSVSFADTAEADRVFAALSEGGEVRMPIQKTEFAARFGMLTDKFGIPWMVSGGHE